MIIYSNLFAGIPHSYVLSPFILFNVLFDGYVNQFICYRQSNSQDWAMLSVKLYIFHYTNRCSIQLGENVSTVLRSMLIYFPTI